ncbi:MAG TPA: ComEA family DNA-binding protein [Polyangiaceae bacterium]
MPAPDLRRDPGARLSNEGRAVSGLSRFVRHPLVKPFAKAMAVLAGLVVLALVGSTAKAVPNANATPIANANANASSNPNPNPNPNASSNPNPNPAPAPAPAPTEHARRATPDDPVTLNAASLDDLRRLPGIGPKRAQAILDLRTKLGRFHQIEDLLRVKGIGRATLKKLRPLVRLE